MEGILRKTPSWSDKYLSDDEEEKEKGQPKRTLSWNEKFTDEKQSQEKSSKFAHLRQRRKSIAPDMSLPPIDEGKNKIDSLSTKSTSDGNGRAVTFNRTTRRASVASTTSLYQHWSAASTDSSPDLLLRRGSWVNKSSGALKRRISNTNVLGRRTSFRTIGSRVTTLLRAKNAFARFKRKPAFQIEEEVEKVSEFEIKELPKEPRFASTLSPEAQYAIMKGYEDVVHNYLCNTYPEYRNMLRRSRTPQGGVTVKPSEKDKEKKKKHEINADDHVDGHEASQNEVVTSTPLPGDTASPQTHIHASQNRSQSTSPHPQNKMDSHLQRNFSRAGNSSKNLARYSSLPNIAPSKDRQLVMTYRYQCAMDILDNVKQQMGLHPLSPRVKATKATPVKEFNSWSYVWNKEFEVK